MQSQVPFHWFDEARKEESKRLNELAVQNAHENGISVYPLLKEGVSFHQILKTAKEIPVDLIVLGTHGRAGLAHAIIGSVAERVGP